MSISEYLTEENSCFVILTNYLNECIGRHSKFPNEHSFPGLREGRGRWRSFKPECLLIFFSCEEGCSFKGDVYLSWGALSDNYGKSLNYLKPYNYLLKMHFKGMFFVQG